MHITLQQTIAELGPLLATCSRRWRRLLDNRLGEHNLSEASATPLIALLRLGDDVPQSLLAQRVGVEGPTLVRIVDELERQGLIKRVPHRIDRRIKLVRLSRSGRRMAETAETAIADVRLQLLAGLDANEVHATVNILKLLAEKTADLVEVQSSVAGD